MALCDSFSALERIEINSYLTIQNMKKKINLYKIVEASGFYIYSTKFESRLFDYCEKTLGYKRPKDLDQAIQLLEQGHFYLITK